jgi:hypothetical protein
MPALAVTLERLRPREGRVPAEELALQARFVNKGDEPVRFNAAQAQHPSLVLEVEGPSEQRVLLRPPPPPTEAELGPGEPLGPGESIELRYGGFLDPALGPGEFRVRFEGRFPSLGGSPDDPLISEWVEFELPRWARPRDYLWPAPWRLQWWRRFIEILLGRLRRCRRVWEEEVDEAITETMSDAPPGAAPWNRTYAWRARFQLRIEERSCTARVNVRVRVTGTITAAQLAAWETEIENAWDKRFKLCSVSNCCSDGFTIVTDIQFVTTGEHQVVNAVASTVDMGMWGASDPSDVDHEFGHMLGAPDEYFTVNGTNWGPGRQPGAPIMNNPANPPVARNYDLIRTRAQALMGSACTTRGVSDPC